MFKNTIFSDRIYGQPFCVFTSLRQIGKYANLLYICELNFFVAFRAKAGREEQNVEYNLINIHYK